MSKINIRSCPSTKVLTQLNKSLLPLLEEDSNFDEVAPSLFGPKFAHKSKELIDQAKAIRSTTPKDKPPFIRQAPPNSQGVTAKDPGEAEAKSPGRRTDSSNRAGELNRQTSNQVSHVCKSFINEFQKYSSMSDRMHGSEQPPVERSSSSGEAVLSSDQLVNSYSRPLGTKYGTGVPDRLRVGATPTVCPKSSTLFLRTNQPDKRGINETPPETGNPTVGTASGGRVLVQHIPGPQEGRRVETSDKSQSPEPQYCVNTEHFKMEGIHIVKDLLRHGDWLAKVNLKDAYFAISIDPTHRRYLKCQILGKIYQFTCLPVIGPVGIHQDAETSTGPSSRDGHASGSLYRRHSDPCGVQGDAALDQAEGMVYLLECLRFVINKDKSVLVPSQTIEFLGLTIDTINMRRELLLPPHKIKMIRAESRKLLRAVPKITIF